HPPITNTPQEGDVTGTLSGTCSGTLSDAAGNSQSLDGRAVRAWVRSHGTEACDVGQGQGRGTMVLGAGRVHFTYDEVRTGPNLVLHVAGAKSGDGLAQG